MMKHIFPFMECGMCGRSANNQCEECEEHYTAVNHLTIPQTHEREIEIIPKKIFIGSGEDGHLFVHHHEL